MDVNGSLLETNGLMIHVGECIGRFGKTLRASFVVLVVILTGPALGADPVREALEALVARQGLEMPEVASFYAQRDFRPVWTAPERGQALLALLAGAATHGLNPADYDLAPPSRLAPGADAPGQAQRDWRLSVVLARLARHLAAGKVDPRRLYPEWNFASPLGLGEAARRLEALVQAPDLAAAVAALAPRSPEYQGLRQALAAYQGQAQAGPWPQVAPGPTLKLGMAGPRVAALRARLAAEGWVPGGDGGVLDPDLAAAVGRFQGRHGLEPDGAVGKRTLAALNVPVEARIEQIRVNLERLRWVARDREGDHLLVDIAGFTARLYLDGRQAWDSRVVVGRPYRKTPAFRADLRYLVLNPRWVVPPTILREDVLPKVARDPAYLEAHAMRVVDRDGQAVAAEEIDWGRYRKGGFPHQIVQVPGPENPLGQIKFMLPNPYLIYLHDTPSRGLFQRTERAQSSGCVRLEKPQELAVLLLDDAERWSLEGLRQALATGATRTLPVKRRVPVLVLYFTAAADEAGGVSFRPDLYGRDGAVLAALNRADPP